MADQKSKGIRAAQVGILVNTTLALIKFVAGVLGNSYALIADAVESGTDIISSLIVMSGLQIAQRDADEDFPYGYGRAETLATAVVALMLLGAAAGIAIQAVREILTPHHLPAPWTLAVLALVVAAKWYLSRRVLNVGTEIGSSAIRSDGWHHMSDALTSLAAFVGISIALWGGPGWEPADDWAALVAVIIIAWNGSSILWSALRDLMDAKPDDEVVETIRQTARSVPSVMAVEKLFVRRMGMDYHIAIHVQADPAMPLLDAHTLGHRVKSTLQQALPNIGGVLVHMEPFRAVHVHEQAPSPIPQRDKSSTP